LPEASSRANSCTKLLGIFAEKHQPRKIETLDDLFNAFTQGFEPDLSIPQYRNAFEIYRKMRFGNPNTNLDLDTLEQIAKELRKHSELKKEPFRNFQVESQARFYPVIK